MKYYFGFTLLSFYLLWGFGPPPTQGVKLCVPEIYARDCQQMALEVNSHQQLVNLKEKLHCVMGRDRLECMEIISRNDADLVNADAQEVFLGNRLQLIPIFQEMISHLNGMTNSLQTVLSTSVAVVKNPSGSINTNNKISLESLRTGISCHTGYDGTAGWHAPIGMLANHSIDCPHLNEEAPSGDLAFIDAFFERSCVPGPWVEDMEFDKHLKNLFPGLCNCDGTSFASSGNAFRGCDYPRFQGAEGALECLQQLPEAVVAFTTAEAAYSIFKGTNNNQYKYLCPDGNTMPINTQNLNTNCFWARKPTNAFIGKSTLQQDSIRIQDINSLFTGMFQPFRGQKWFMTAFVSNETVTGIQRLQPNNMMDQYQQYIKDFRHTIDKPLPPSCQPEDIRVCVSSEQEDRKCRHFAEAAYARRLRPQVRCDLRNSRYECIRAVNNSEATFVSLEAHEMFFAGRKYYLRPVAAETSLRSGSSYYPVAVVRSDDNNIRNFHDLRGKTSCHGSVASFSGWVASVTTLKHHKLIKPRWGSCNVMSPMAAFFSGGSCAPGAREEAYSKDRTSSDRLCQQCRGDEYGEQLCRDSPGELYWGDTGALRCLVEGRGDVAFVRHDTVYWNTERRANDSWNLLLKGSQFRLLCGDGRTADVDSWQSCNLLGVKIPSNHVMMGAIQPSLQGQKENNRTWYTLNHFLSRASAAFGPETTTFRLFSTYQNRSDLMFSNTVRQLKPVEGRLNYRAILGEYLFTLAVHVDPYHCSAPSSLLASLLLSTLLPLLLTRLTG